MIRNDLFDDRDSETYRFLLLIVQVSVIDRVQKMFLHGWRIIRCLDLMKMMMSFLERVSRNRLMVALSKTYLQKTFLKQLAHRGPGAPRRPKRSGSLSRPRRSRRQPLQNRRRPRQSRSHRSLSLSRHRWFR